MPYRNVEDRKASQREYTKRRNEEASPRTEFPEALRAQRPIKNVADVLSRVDAYLTLLESGVMPIATRARTAKELLSVALKSLEIADLGWRIKKIEEQLRQRGLALPVNAPAPGQDEHDTEMETIQ